MKVVLNPDGTITTVAPGYSIEDVAALTGGTIINEADYVPPAPTPEEVLAAERAAWKIVRDAAVAAIVVKTGSGQAFDGDEISQSRMARAILGMQTQPEGATVQWVLHDNTVVDVGIAELQEALTLAGLRQTELWVQA